MLRKHGLTILGRVFCPFTSSGDLAIEPRLVESFYRSLTLYWVSQVVEMGIIAWFAAVAVYGTIGRLAGTVSPDAQGKLMSVMALSVCLGAINALAFVRPVRKAVRQRAELEIDEIFQIYRAELRRRVLAEAARFNMLSNAPYARRWMEKHQVSILRCVADLTRSSSRLR